MIDATRSDGTLSFGEFGSHWSLLRVVEDGSVGAVGANHGLIAGLNRVAEKFWISFGEVGLGSDG